MRVPNLALATIATTTLAALSPAISVADPSDTALSACVKAFAAKITVPGAEPPAVKIDYPQRHSVGSVMDYYARNYTFTMTARKVKSGTEFAQATCLADSRGVVISFNSKLDPVTKVASR
jgi:hypothetical protein